MAELETSLSPGELTEWIAYHELEPFGTPVEDDRWRTFCTLFYSANSKSGTRIPEFFDRDRAETERVRQEIESQSDLDTKLARYFGARAQASN